MGVLFHQDNAPANKTSVVAMAAVHVTVVLNGFIIIIHMLLI